MKAKLYVPFFATAVLFSAPAVAQLMCSLGTSIGQQYDALMDQSPGSRAQSELTLISQVLCPQGCGFVTLASNSTVPNAMALTQGQGSSKIAFNSGFMNQVASQFGGGASLGILAHEFGHHVDFHSTPPWMNNSWSRELKADAWAGCALARIGVGTVQVDNALRAIAAYPSASHPSWQLRLPAVRAGFTSCGGQWLNSFNLGLSSSASPPVLPAQICQTNFGQCSLTAPTLQGNPCSCAVMNTFGQVLRTDPGVAR